MVLGQVQVAAKSNEIPALRTLLEVFDLVGAVVTADATGTQTTTAAYITGRGGHYVLTVKGNQRGLFRRCKAWPWAKLRATSAPDLGHGRRVRRTIKVAAAPALLDFAAVTTSSTAKLWWLTRSPQLPLERSHSSSDRTGYQG